jgi:hypothetical protein
VQAVQDYVEVPFIIFTNHPRSSCILNRHLVSILRACSDLLCVIPSSLNPSLPFVPHPVAWQAAPDDAEIFVRNIQDYVSVRFPFLELTEHHKQVSISRARLCSLRSPRNVRSAAVYLLLSSSLTIMHNRLLAR